LLDEKCGSGSEGMMLIAPPIFSPLGWSGPCSALDDLFDAKAVAEADLPRRFLPRRLTRLDICLSTFFFDVF